ncbi:MAG: hypothetical protein HRF49_08685 [bacterium]
MHPKFAPIPAGKAVLAGFAAALLAVSSCDLGISGVNFVPFPDVINHSYSFESGLEGWAPIGIELGDPPASWSIDESLNYKSDGEKSLKLTLSNPADSAKIFIERVFSLDRSSTYSVKVRYSFCSKDGGAVDKWKVITGVSAEQPRAAAALSFPGDTGNDGFALFTWKERTYDFMYETGASRKAYITIGVWGTTADDREYYVDNVRITFTKVKQTE